MELKSTLEVTFVLMAFYLIKHTKGEEIKFTGHLDLSKAVQRTIDRASIGIMYSKGFNPHMLISSAQPVPVGQISEAEYILVELDTNLSPEEILNRLNEESPEGIEFLFIKKLEEAKKSPMSLIRAIKYEILVPGGMDLLGQIQRLILKEEWKIRTISKKGVEREEDIRQKILKISCDLLDDDTIKIDLTASSGSDNHLSTDNFLKYISENTNDYPKDRFIRVTRKEMYLSATRGLKSMEEM